MTKRDTKEIIIRSTAYLMQKKGYFGTGLNDIIKHSGAPKGSIYYHFPNGKEEIAEAAIKWTEKTVTSFIKEELQKYDEALPAVKQFILDSARRFETDEYFVGVPITAVVLETSTSSEKLRNSCHHAFEVWSEEFTLKLLRNGYPPEEAEKLGKLINSMIQGALISALAKGDASPLRNTAEMVPLIFKEEA